MSEASASIPCKPFQELLPKDFQMSTDGFVNQALCIEFEQMER